MRVKTRGGKRLRACPHDEVIVTTNSGLERAVCENCGHVSFRFLDEIRAEVNRERFARPADDADEGWPFASD